MSPRATSNEAAPTADETIASIITLRQPKKAKTDAARARAYRQRKRQKAKAVASPNHESSSSESLIPEGFSSAVSTLVEPPAPAPIVTRSDVTRDEGAPSRSISTILLRAAALALAAVGLAMNGWFARSLGSSDAAGWLFLAIGVAADLVALVAPSCAARLWQARHVTRCRRGIASAKAVSASSAANANWRLMKDGRHSTLPCKRSDRRRTRKRTRRSGSWRGQPMGRYNPPAMTSQCSGLSCWRCCRRSAAYCSWSGDQPNERRPAPSQVLHNRR